MSDVANVFKSETKSAEANVFISATTSAVANVFISETTSAVPKIAISATAAVVPKIAISLATALRADNPVVAISVSGSPSASKPKILDALVAFAGNVISIVDGS